AQAEKLMEGLDGEELFRKFAEMEPADIVSTPEWKTIEEVRENVLGTELFWDVAGHATLESNQDFSSTQAAYGLQGGLVFREWRADGAFSLFNFFDYPAALVRLLTGMDKSFSPSGLDWPSLTLGLDLVDPSD